MLLNTFNYTRVVLIVLQRSYFGTCNYRDRELIVQREMTGVGRGDPLKNENLQF